ncbi:MAG TPA: hypothetical protein H9972_11220, partial [Candidatus Paraprevotella stercorigallinarum]|nr:hypothetical protein [Candidatus Paraprevotella stercorigallinarum]
HVLNVLYTLLAIAGHQSYGRTSFRTWIPVGQEPIRFIVNHLTYGIYRKSKTSINRIRITCYRHLQHEKIPFGFFPKGISAKMNIKH